MGTDRGLIQNPNFYFCARPIVGVTASWQLSLSLVNFVKRGEMGDMLNL